MTPEQISALDAKLASQIGDDVQRIYDHEALFKETRAALKAQAAELATLRAERDALRSAASPVIELLDGLVAESGRGVDWGEEDAFRMGEWFEAHDIAAIERLRVLKGGA